MTSETAREVRAQLRVAELQRRALLGREVLVVLFAVGSILAGLNPASAAAAETRQVMCYLGACLLVAAAVYRTYAAVFILPRLRTLRAEAETLRGAGYEV